VCDGGGGRGGMSSCDPAIELLYLAELVKGLVVLNISKTITAWRQLFDIRGPLVHELILEFFSTFRFREDVLDLDTLGALQIIADLVFAGRSQAPEKVTVTDLFYLRGMGVGSVNVPYLLAWYLRLFSSGRKHGAMISGGQFVACLAEHFGLITEEILQGLTMIVRELPVNDMAEIVKLLREALMHRDIRWDEDEEDASGCATTTRSGFSTWTVTSLARLMDRVGVPYTRYSKSPVEYQRRTRQKTDEPSTSTALQ
ncbi:hypothetical protein Tco_0837640, partial [Tanacetum coccineum]